MENQQCNNCKFWKKIKQLEGYEIKAYEGMGDCRRFPPTIQILTQTQFPAVPPHGWCGEWQQSNPQAMLPDSRSTQPVS